MHKMSDMTTRKRVFELTETMVEEIIANEVIAKNNLPEKAVVVVEIDIGSSGLFRGATVTVTETVNS